MHPLDRPYQLESYQNLISSTKKWIVIEAPTGSGKTAWAAQSGHDFFKSLALVRTKSLQEQYASSYQFNVVKGKGNYDCWHNSMDSADLCEIDTYDLQSCEKNRKHECECKKTCRFMVELKEMCREECPYYVACNKFVGSYHGSLNYTKYLLELYEKGLVERFMPASLFLDEAHELSNLTCEWSGITFTWRSKRGVPNYVLDFADIPPEINPEQLGQELSRAMGLQWLIDLKQSLIDNRPPKPWRGCPTDITKEWKRWNELFLRVDNTLSLIYQGRELWYIKSDNEGFLAKPLTARFHFPHLFNKAPKVVLMSATIGQFSTFAAELGLSDYEAIQVPNSWPAPLRPIEDLGGPEYTYKMDENERNHHAQLIASRIAACPDWWSGIVHVTSKAMANELGQRLRYLLNRPIMIPFEGWGTEQAIDEWYGFCEREKGALVVSWAFWEGIDAGRNQISIVARCPYPDFKSAYEKARFEFDRRAALQRIANQVVQAWGRVRRGRAEDYGPSKLVAICDAKWKRLRNYISQDIMESIVEMEMA